jgi:hypothetical protein
MILQRISLIATTFIFLAGVAATQHYSQSLREQWRDAAVDLWLIPSLVEGIEGHWVASDTGTLLRSAIVEFQLSLAERQQRLFPQQSWIASLQVDYLGNHQFTDQRESSHIERQLMIHGENIPLGLSIAMPNALPLTSILAFLVSYAAVITARFKLWPEPYSDWELAKLDELSEKVAAPILQEIRSEVKRHPGGIDQEVFFEVRNAGTSRSSSASISRNSASLFRELFAYSWSASEAVRYILNGGKALTEEQARWFRIISDIHGLEHPTAEAAARKHTDFEFDPPNCRVILGGLEVAMSPQPLALYELIVTEGKEDATAVIRPPENVPDRELGRRVAKRYQSYKGYRESTREKLEDNGMEANQFNQQITKANDAIATMVSDKYFLERYFQITKVPEAKRSRYVVGAADRKPPHAVDL